MFTSCFRLNYAVEYAVEPIIINEDIVFLPLFLSRYFKNYEQPLQKFF